MRDTMAQKAPGVRDIGYNTTHPVGLSSCHCIKSFIPHQPQTYPQQR